LIAKRVTIAGTGRIAGPCGAYAMRLQRQKAYQKVTFVENSDALLELFRFFGQYALTNPQFYGTI
jgi:hypothetical protein